MQVQRAENFTGVRSRAMTGLLRVGSLSRCYGRLMSPLLPDTQDEHGGVTQDEHLEAGMPKSCLGWPCQPIAAIAHAATAASASPRADPVGPGGDGSRPSRVTATMTRRPNDDEASWSSCPARPRSRRSQPRTVAPGTPSSAPSLAVPVPCSTDRAVARAITPAPSARRGTAHDGMSRCVALQARHRPRLARSRRRSPPDSRMTRSRPYPPGPQQARPAGRAGQRAGRQVRGSGLRVRAQQHLPRPFPARGNLCCSLPAAVARRNQVPVIAPGTTR
jgi:hypothetical protein